MCQAIVDGGRRCPVHRNDSIVAIAIAKNSTQLPEYLLEGIFSDLRKEAPENTEEFDSGISQNLRTRIDGTEDFPRRERYLGLLAQDTDLENLDYKTVYAIRNLERRAELVKSNLYNEIEDISRQLGITKALAISKFQALLSPRGDLGAQSVPSDVYNEQGKQIAASKGLPTSEKVLKALYLLEQGVQYGERSVRMQEIRPVSVRMIRAGNPFRKMGYNPEAGNGRLEIAFNRNPDIEEDSTKVYVYHNVSQQEYDLLRTTGSVSVFQSRIRGKLVDGEQERRARNLIRCASCGQFRGNTHDCPTVMALEGSEELELFRLSEEDEAEATPTEDATTEDAPESAETAESEAVADDAEDATEAVSEAPESAEASEASESEGESASDSQATPIERVSPPEGYVPGEFINRDLIPEEGVLQVENINRYISNISVEGALVKIKEVQFSEDDEEAKEVIVIEPTVEPIVYEYDVEPLSLEEQANLVVPDAPEGFDYTEKILGRVDIDRNPEIENRAWHFLGHIGSIRLPEGYREVTTLRPGRLEGSWELRERSEPLNDFVLMPKTPDGRGNLSLGYSWRRGSGVGQIYRDIISTPCALAKKTPEELLAEYNASGKADVETIEVEPNATTTRVGMHAPESGTTLKIGYAPVRKIRNMLNEGKAVTSHLVWDSSRTRGRHVNHFINDLGVKLENDYTVTGKMSIRKKDNGGIEILSGAHELKCDCREYRRSTSNPKSCGHINHVYRNFVRYAYSVAGGDATNHQTGPGSRSGVNVGGVSLPRTLADKNPRVSTSEDGKRRITFPYILRRTSKRSSGGGWYTGTGPAIGGWLEVLRQNDNPFRTPIIESASSINGISASLNHNEIKRALRDVDEVEISANLNFGGGRSHYSFLLSGVKIVFGKNEAGEIIKKGIEFPPRRCSCGRFTNGNCQHERAISDYAVNIFATKPEESLDFHRDEMNRLLREYDFVKNPLLIENKLVGINSALEYIPQEYVDDLKEDIDFVKESLPTIMSANNNLDSEPDQETLSIIRQSMARFTSLTKKVSEFREIVDIHAEISNYAQTYANDKARKADVVEVFDSYRNARRDYWRQWDEAPKLTEFDHEELCSKIKKYENINPSESLEELEVSDFENMASSEVEGSRRFGIELEYVTSGNSSSTLNSIAEKLHAKGLSRENYARGYHSASRGGWSEWVAETDVSVSGEIVSPIMDVSEKSFADLKDVLDIIKSEGGKTDKRVGAHVHISTGSYEGKSTKHVELFKLIQEYTPVFYRVAADPSYRRHRLARGSSYAQPVVLPSKHNLELNKDQLYDVSTLKSNIARYSAVNPAGSGFFKKGDHIEFRLFDGTLDYKVTQTQVAMAMYLTELAEKNVEVSGKTQKREYGDFSSISYKREIDENDPTTTEALRGFLNLFPNQKIRENIIKLFSFNKWTG